MKAVISGSSGFLGSHLARALVSRGLQVTPIARDLLYSAIDLNRFLTKEQPDYVFHLAAYGHIAGKKDISTTFAANLVCGFNLLKESLHIPYRAFVNFGSSSEYGRKTRAMSETDALAPETFYAATKAGLTHLSGAFARQFSKPIFTVRPFSVYGPAEAESKFIPTVIHSLLTGIPFPLDENAQHDWIYIDDFIAGVLLVIEHAQRLSDNQRVINVGSGEMHSNKEICETLKQIAGRDYRATSATGLRAHDSSVWQSDNRLISSLGFHPRHTLAQGLARTFEHYRQKHESSHRELLVNTTTGAPPPRP